MHFWRKKQFCCRWIYQILNMDYSRIICQNFVRKVRSTKFVTGHRASLADIAALPRPNQAEAAVTMKWPQTWSWNLNSRQKFRSTKVDTLVLCEPRPHLVDHHKKAFWEILYQFSNMDFLNKNCIFSFRAE